LKILNRLYDIHVTWFGPVYASKISNIPYNIIFTAKSNDSFDFSDDYFM